jgi:YYY domain-containing protein
VVDALVLWTAAELLGALALPLTLNLFRGAPWATAYSWPLGLLVAGYPAWILASLHVAAFSPATATGGVLVLATASYTCLRRGARIRRSHLVVWGAAHLVFLVAFGSALLLRSFTPDVWGVEKPMDMAFIDAVSRAHFFPPADPWYSGSSLNYYYFGHYLIAWLIRVTGSTAATAYNVAVALVFAFTATAVFGVGAGLYSAFDRERASARRILAAGGAAGALSMLIGTLATASALVAARGSLLRFHWWEPSRVIAHAANDFPFYSLLIGDLHAHVLVMPFELLVIGLAVSVALDGPRVSDPVSLVLVALVVGMIGATNSFSAPVAAAILVGAAVLWGAENRRFGAAVGWTIAVLILATIFFLPFLLGFDSPAGGIGFVDSHDAFWRFGRDEFLLYGLFIWLIAPASVGALMRISPRRLAQAGIAAAALVALAAFAGEAVGVSAALVTAVFLYAPTEDGLPVNRRLFRLIVAGGVVCALLSQLVYLRDAFDTGLDYRFNTIFKLGYQAWYFFAVAAAVVLVRNWQRGGAWWRIWRLGAISLGAVALSYPFAGAYAETGAFSRAPTLDGIGWLRAKAPADVQAIGWLNRNVYGHPTILEATGPDFDPAGHGRVSVYTGLPTVLGWLGHEIQWGRHPGTRWDDVRTIYATRDISEARRLLRRYHVEYVFVGQLERSDYPAATLAKFQRLGRVAYRAGSTEIYRVRS